MGWVDLVMLTCVHDARGACCATVRWRKRVSKHPDWVSDLELADAIAAVRAELKRARDDGSEEALRFRLGPVELELGLEVSGSGGIKGGVKVWVVSLEGSGARARTATHRVKLQLFPTDEHGEDIDIAGMTPAKPVG